MQFQMGQKYYLSGEITLSSGKDIPVETKILARTMTQFSLAAAPIALAVGLCALPATAFAQSTSPSETAKSTTPDVVNEGPDIVVTAQKREQKLIDVPIAVTAISTARLEQSNQVRLQDYFNTVPGLNLMPSGFQNAPMLSIRGISTGGAFLQPTVGVVVDDIPFGASVGLVGGYAAPDLDPADLARIEVLRGPQGTLYGASSIGGLIKYVTVDPSTKEFNARLQVGAEGVENGNGIGHSVRGSVNIPVSDNFAVRASAFTRQDVGYIDDPAQGAKGVNEVNVYGGRLAAMLTLSDQWSIKVSGSYQHSKGDGSSFVNDTLGDLQHQELIGTGGYYRELQAYSAIIKGKLGPVDLTSLTGYNIDKSYGSLDYSGILGGTAQFFYGVGGAPIYNGDNNRKFSQELRLNSTLGDHIEWVVGGFYTKENYFHQQRTPAVDQATGKEVGVTFISTGPRSFEEVAGFGDIIAHLTDKLSIQIGGRESSIRQTNGPSQLFSMAPSGTVNTTNPIIKEKESAFTYLASPSYKINENLMIYARFASGYRAGGGGTASSTDICIINNFPCSYKPDKTNDYEVGLKGNILDRKLSFDASIYKIDWNDIQLTLQKGNFSYTDNAASAVSNGAEFSLEAGPFNGFWLSGWVAYNDAKLAKDFPVNAAGSFGLKDARLPFSSKVSASVTARQDFSLTNTLKGSLGVTASYVGDRYGLFTSSAVRQQYPAYTKIDVNVGVRDKDWSINLYVNNLTDKRTPLSGGIGTAFPNAFVILQPRTVGVTASRSF
jgi:outer membrane receptor protein involved in Fe transport